MTYKHQNDVIDAVDFMKPSYGTEKHRAVQKEVNDIYRKAEVFDAIIREWEDERVTKSHILETIQKYYDEYETGEYDA